MKINEVSLEDGKQCAHLINSMKLVTGLSASDAEAFVAAKRWLHALAGQMAEQLKDHPEVSKPKETQAASAGGIKIKSAGTLSKEQIKSIRSKKKKQ